jgi:hypothetical protein
MQRSSSGAGERSLIGLTGQSKALPETKLIESADDAAAVPGRDLASCRLRYGLVLHATLAGPSGSMFFDPRGTERWHDFMYGSETDAITQDIAFEGKKHHLSRGWHGRCMIEKSEAHIV